MSDDLPFGSQGGLAFRHQFPATGDYTITVTLRRQLYRYIIGMGEPHQIDVRLDGVRVRRFTIGGEGQGLTAPESFAGNTQGDPQWEVYMHTADEGLQVRVPVSAGAHDVSVSFVRRYWEPEGILQPPQRGFARTTNELYHGHPAVDTVAVAGPLRPAAGGRRRRPRAARGCSCVSRRTPGRARRPARGGFSSAWPRAPTAGRSRAAELETLMRVLRRAARRRCSFDAGIQRGLERVLAAPGVSLPRRARAGRAGAAARSFR